MPDIRISDEGSRIYIINDALSIWPMEHIVLWIQVMFSLVVLMMVVMMMMMMMMMMMTMTMTMTMMMMITMMTTMMMMMMMMTITMMMISSSSSSPPQSSSSPLSPLSSTSLLFYFRWYWALQDVSLVWQWRDTSLIECIEHVWQKILIPRHHSPSSSSSSLLQSPSPTAQLGTMVTLSLIMIIVPSQLSCKYDIVGKIFFHCLVYTYDNICIDNVSWLPYFHSPYILLSCSSWI